MFYSTSNTHSCAGAMHDAALPKFPNMFISRAGGLCNVDNISKKEGLVTHVAKHPISEELATVGNTPNMGY